MTCSAYLGECNCKINVRSKGLYLIILGPIVQSIVSLMSLLVAKMLTVLVSKIFNSQVVLLKNHIFSAKILAYMSYLKIKVLTIS